MLKIGIIGLGDIAQKAYLPLIGAKPLDLHLFTRNQETLARIGQQYRIKNLHSNLSSLIDRGISAAFVHAPTAAHEALVEQLLTHDIHVLVDKPVTYDLASTDKLVSLAQNRNRILAVGFNRRFAPAYQKLKELRQPNMILMQKNRRSLPGDVRTFVFDDFIHVIDTLLYLFPYPIETITVTGRKKGKLLYHAMIQLTAAEGQTAIGIMNRDAGTVEESVEVFSSDEKRVVRNFSEVTIHVDKTETRLAANDWESTLHRRGFEPMINNFIESLSTAPATSVYEATRLTHQLCELAVEKLEALKLAGF